MDSGKRKTLIAGSVGLVALGTIALTAQKRRRGTDTMADEMPDMDGTTAEIDSIEMPAVMEMPAASETSRPEMDPAIE